MANKNFNKSILNYFSKTNDDLPPYILHKKDLEIEFKSDDFSIYFNFLYSKIGVVIRAYSTCFFKINSVVEFYLNSKYKPSNEYQFGFKNHKISEKLFNEKMYNGQDEFYFNINDDFEERIIEFAEIQKMYIKKILDVYEFELKNNLKEQFDNKNKNGIFNFCDSDLLVLYHLYKPIELPNFLIEYNKKYILEKVNIIDEKNILITEICELNNLNPEKYIIKPSILQMIRSIFK